MKNVICSICGGNEFRENSVLWQGLVSEWQLSGCERAYIDRQQGCSCQRCGANLRIVALANAVRGVVGTNLPLRQAIAEGFMSGLRILDCNGAEGLSATLAELPGYMRADYPQYDIRRLPFTDGIFDLVLHSDTLEHVEHPVVGLEECRRILAPRGRLCYTVPIIVGRLSRNRAGLAPSYHAGPSPDADDFIVHTEFGADAWTIVLEAGFSNVSFNQVEYPAALAITAWNT